MISENCKTIIIWINININIFIARKTEKTRDNKYRIFNIYTYHCDWMWYYLQVQANIEPDYIFFPDNNLIFIFVMSQLIEWYMCIVGMNGK